MSAQVQPEGCQSPLPLGRACVTDDGRANVFMFTKAEDYEEEYVKMLVAGKSYGLPGTDGTLWSNWKRFVANNHSILSIFLADEKHPFSRNERLVVNFAFMAWAFFIAVIFNVEESALAWYLVSLATAACTIPYANLLKVLAECGCIQTCRTRCCKKFLEILGSICLAVFALLGILWLTLGSIKAHNAGKVSFIWAWLTSVVQSWLLWFIYWLPFFLYKQYKEKPKFRERFPECVAIASPCGPEQGLIGGTFDGSRASPVDPISLSKGAVQISAHAVINPAVVVVGTPQSVQNPILFSTTGAPPPLQGIIATSTTPPLSPQQAFSPMPPPYQQDPRALASAPPILSYSSQEPHRQQMMSPSAYQQQQQQPYRPGTCPPTAGMAFEMQQQPVVPFGFDTGVGAQPAYYGAPPLVASPPPPYQMDPSPAVIGGGRGSMQVVVPPGILPGQSMTLTTPLGKQIYVILPPGLSPGSVFTVPY